MQSENSTTAESGVYAFERLLDEATASGDTASDNLIWKRQEDKQANAQSIVIFAS